MLDKTNTAADRRSRQ